MHLYSNRGRLHVSKTQSSADFSDYPDFLSLNATEKPLKLTGLERRAHFSHARELFPNKTRTDFADRG